MLFGVENTYIEILYYQQGLTYHSAGLIIDKIDFAIAALNKNSKTLVIHVTMHN